MTTFDCWFCAFAARSVEKLARHLVATHKDATVPESGTSLRFRVYKIYRRHRVLCVCGEGFSCAEERKTPRFFDWTDDSDDNSFTAHLRREGGPTKHLQAVKDKALLDKVGGSRDNAGSRFEVVDVCATSGR